MNLQQFHIMPPIVSFTVWCTYTTRTTIGEEADRTSYKLNSQVRLGSPAVLFFKDIEDSNVINR